jgi:hypothetical protein
MALDDRNLLTTAFGQAARQNLAGWARADDYYVKFPFHLFAPNLVRLFLPRKCAVANVSCGAYRRIQLRRVPKDSARALAIHGQQAPRPALQ